MRPTSLKALPSPSRVATVSPMSRAVPSVQIAGRRARFLSPGE